MLLEASTLQESGSFGRTRKGSCPWFTCIVSCEQWERRRRNITQSASLYHGTLGTQSLVHHRMLSFGMSGSSAQRRRCFVPASDYRQKWPSLSMITELLDPRLAFIVHLHMRLFMG